MTVARVIVILIGISLIPICLYQRELYKWDRAGFVIDHNTKLWESADGTCGVQITSNGVEIVTVSGYTQVSKNPSLIVKGATERAIIHQTSKLEVKQLLRHIQIKSDFMLDDWSYSLDFKYLFETQNDLEIHDNLSYHETIEFLKDKLGLSNADIQKSGFVRWPHFTIEIQKESVSTVFMYGKVENESHIITHVSSNLSDLIVSVLLDGYAKFFFWVLVVAVLGVLIRF